MFSDDELKTMNPHVADRYRYATRVPFSRTGSDMYLQFGGHLGWPKHQMCACPSTLLDRPPTPAFLTFLVAICQPAHVSCKSLGGKTTLNTARISPTQPIQPFEALPAVPATPDNTPEEEHLSRYGRRVKPPQRLHQVIPEDESL